jgi:hypothetical protein
MKISKSGFDLNPDFREIKHLYRTYVQYNSFLFIEYSHENRKIDFGWGWIGDAEDLSAWTVSRGLRGGLK